MLISRGANVDFENHVRGRLLSFLCVHVLIMSAKILDAISKVSAILLRIFFFVSPVDSASFELSY